LRVHVYYYAIPVRGGKNVTNLSRPKAWFGSFPTPSRAKDDESLRREEEKSSWRPKREEGESG